MKLSKMSKEELESYSYVELAEMILKEGKKSVTEEEFSAHLFTAGIPDPDIIVRTSAEQRVSNYMLWQMAYSEFMFILDKHWPDMKKEDVDKIILEYTKRDRRFGAIKEQKWKQGF